MVCGVLKLILFCQNMLSYLELMTSFFSAILIQNTADTGKIQGRLPGCSHIIIISFISVLQDQAVEFLHCYLLVIRISCYSGGITSNFIKTRNHMINWNIYTLAWKNIPDNTYYKAKFQKLQQTLCTKYYKVKMTIHLLLGKCYSTSLGCNYTGLQLSHLYCSNSETLLLFYQTWISLPLLKIHV